MITNDYYIDLTDYGEVYLSNHRSEIRKKIKEEIIYLKALEEEGVKLL